MINIISRMKYTLFILCAVVLGIGIGTAVTTRMIRPMQINGMPIGRFERQYPGFFLGPMVNARPGDLPDGTLVKTSNYSVSMADIENVMRSEGPKVAEWIKLNMPAVVERLASTLLLKQELWDYAQKQGIPKNTPESAIDEAYQADLVRTSDVTDADIEAYYKQLTKQYGDSLPPLDVLRDQIKQRLIEDGMQKIVTLRINQHAQRSVVNRKWVEAQYEIQLQRPEVQAVEKLRYSGKPSVLIFAMDEPKMLSAGQQQIDELKPLVNGKAQAGVVPTIPSTFLAGRYRIGGLGYVTIVFNADGREVFRTIGQVPTEDLLMILKQAGM